MAQGTVGVNILSNIVGIGGSNVSSFGDIIVAEPTPEIQLDFVYGINTQTGSSTTSNSATVDTNASRLRLQSGTNSAGAATFTSTRIAKYRQGQGMIARFTGIWLANAASSIQVLGAGNSAVGYFFGYNGTAFGINLRNNSTDNWVAQSSWNGDKCNGTGASGFTWNQALGNVMMIQYPYLGYGAITFWVMNPVNGQWILCHTIQYPNSSVNVQVSNPGISFYANITNSGNTTNLTMLTGSVGIFVSGKINYPGPQWAIDNSKAVTTENCIFNLQNCTTYNTVTNQGLIRLRQISASSTGGTGVNAVIRMKKGVTIGGSPSYTTINGTTANNGVTITSGNSIASYDVAGTTVTGGTYIWQGQLSGANNFILNLSEYNIFVAPGEIMTFSGFSSTSQTVAVGVNWNEDT